MRYLYWIVFSALLYLVSFAYASEKAAVSFFDPPTAVITNSPTGSSFDAGQTLSFSGNSSHVNDPWAVIMSYKWYVNNVYQASGSSWSYTFSSGAGSYVIKLEVKDDNFQTDTETKTITIVEQMENPTATFSYSPYTSTFYVGEVISLNGTGSHDNDENNSSITSYKWYVDNVYKSSSSTYNHVFDLPFGTSQKTEAVKLIVTDDEGVTATYTRYFTVLSRAPTAAFSYFPSKTSFIVGEEIDLRGNLSIDNDEGGNAITAYKWYVDNQLKSSSSFFMYTFDLPYGSPSKTMPIKLTVTDDEGMTHSKTVYYYVSSIAPTASFTSSPSGTAFSAGAAVTFNGSTSYDNDEANTSIVAYSWRVDGVVKSTASSFTHTFNYTDAVTQKIIPVVLTVTDDEGHTASKTVNYTISSLPPTASFSNSPAGTAFNMGAAVTLNGNGSFDNDEANTSITAYSWRVDGVVLSTASSYTHTFNYTDAVPQKLIPVVLTVTDDEGHTATKTVNYTISSLTPTASFTYTTPPTDGFFSGDEITFDGSASHDNDEGNQSITSYEWYVDDLAVGTTSILYHSFSVPVGMEEKIFEVKLRVKDDELGYSSYYIQNITIQKQQGKWFFYIKDNLGSTRAVVNEYGEVVEAMDYYPFGLIMRHNIDAVNSAKESYTGKEQDAESNLHYFGARYYDAAIGRWLSVDPLAVESTNITPFHYTSNNPINKFDPDGLSDLFFNRNMNELTLVSSSGNILGSWKAANNVDSKSNGKWSDGKFKFAYYKDHSGEGASSTYGDIGNFVFDVEGKTGMGIHGGKEGIPDGLGRTGVEHCTFGCIRSLDEAIQVISKTHFGNDPLQTITVGTISPSKKNKKNKISILEAEEDDNDSNFSTIGEIPEWVLKKISQVKEIFMGPKTGDNTER